MYGHDVIHDLNNSFFEPTRDLSDFYIGKIQNSIHFFMGKASDIFKLADLGKYGEASVFEGDLGKHVRPPYPLIALSMDCPAESNTPKDPHPEDMDRYTKQMLIIEEKEFGDGLDILQIIYVPRLGLWFPTYIRFEFLNVTGESSSGHNVKFAASRFSPHVTESAMWDFIGPRPVVPSLANASLMLLNTKNIEHSRKPAPAWINRKRIRKGKPPLFSYHTLRLKLPGKVKKGKNGNAASPGTTRLHLCRGHFKLYTEENPLLGKYTGRYWWQPHARGNRRRGVAMKDYAVTTNPEATV